MEDIATLLQRYDRAMDLHLSVCTRDPSLWHQLDTGEFIRLSALLSPHAENGDMRCQYALATIYFLGSCCQSEEQRQQDYVVSLEIASRWWSAAASQGHSFALDNLITCGVGAEAERVREACRQFELRRKDFVGWSEEANLPIYGMDYMQELCKAIYGRVVTDNTSVG